jgi:hypothetical protein
MLRRLKRRVRWMLGFEADARLRLPTKVSQQQRSGEEPSRAALDALARPIVERLYEDEQLRGDLSDAGITPLLDLVVRLVDAAAARAASEPAATGIMEQLSEQAVTLARALVRLAESGDAEAARAAIAAPLVADSLIQSGTDVLTAPLHAAAPDERAREIARRLTIAVGGSPA